MSASESSCFPIADSAPNNRATKHYRYRDLDLTHEPLGPNDPSDVSVKDFDGHGSAVLRVVREVHGCHPALRNLAYDVIAAQQRRWRRGRLGEQWCELGGRGMSEDAVPELAGIEIHAPGGLNAALRERAAEVADAWLADISQVTELILDQRIALY